MEARNNEGVGPSSSKQIAHVPKTKARSPRLSGRNDLSFSTCVKTLTNVTMSRRGLLHLELAVGLAVFMDFGVANRAAKAMLGEIYSRAGYDCATSEGKEYKTVNRRVAASASLFGKLGQEVVTGWVMEKKETKLLQTIAQQLGQFNFNSMDDVLDFVGRTSNRTLQEKSASPFDIEVGDVTVHLPKKLTEGQLIELASKILSLAEAVKAAAQEEEAATASDTLGERRQRALPVDNERRGQTLH